MGSSSPQDGAVHLRSAGETDLPVQSVQGNRPPSIRMLTGDIAGVYAAEERAHLANSDTLPKRFAGTEASHWAAISCSEDPVRSAEAAKPARRRSVSKYPGRRLFMVTFLPATDRATPATKAVRPARAPLDRSRSGERHPDADRSDVDDPTKPTGGHGVDDLDEFDRSDHVHSDAVEQSLPVKDTEVRNGGPPLLLTKISASGQAARRSPGPRGVLISAGTDRIGACGFADVFGGLIKNCRIPAVDDERDACLGKRQGTGFAESRLDAQTMALFPRIPRSTYTSIRRDIYAGINPCRAFVGPIVGMSFCLLQEGYVIL